MLHVTTRHYFGVKTYRTYRNVFYKCLHFEIQVYGTYTNGCSLWSTVELHVQLLYMGMQQNLTSAIH